MNSAAGTTTYARGGRVELEEIFRAHQKEIYVYFLRTLGDRSLAEDLAQDTFLRALRGSLLYRAEASIRTWLFSIARNVLADHFRRHRTTTPEVPETTHDPQTDRRMAIEQALAAIPLPSREAIVLCDVLGFSPSEASSVTGTTPNAFRVRLHRARTQFREVYGDEA